MLKDKDKHNFILLSGFPTKGRSGTRSSVKRGFISEKRQGLSFLWASKTVIVTLHGVSYITVITTQILNIFVYHLDHSCFLLSSLVLHYMIVVN